MLKGMLLSSWRLFPEWAVLVFDGGLECTANAKVVQESGGGVGEVFQLKVKKTNRGVRVVGMQKGGAWRGIAERVGSLFPGKSYSPSIAQV